MKIVFLMVLYKVNEFPKNRKIYLHHQEVSFLEPDQITGSQEQIKKKLFSWTNSDFLKLYEIEYISIKHATTKSQVAFVQTKCKYSFIVKQHSLLENYKSELMAYLLLSKCSIPKLFDYSLKNKLLIIEYYKDPFLFNGKNSILTYAKFIGNLHRTVIPKLQYLNNSFSLEKISQISRNFVNEAKATEFFNTVSKRLGKLYVSFILGDQKKEHYLRSKQRMILIDLETFRLGQIEHFDLLACCNLSHLDYLTLEEAKCFVETYCSNRGKVNGNEVKPCQLWEELELLAQALGYKSLMAVWGQN